MDDHQPHHTKVPDDEGKAEPIDHQLLDVHYLPTIQSTQYHYTSHRASVSRPLKQLEYKSDKNLRSLASIGTASGGNGKPFVICLCLSSFHGVALQSVHFDKGDIISREREWTDVYISSTGADSHEIHRRYDEEKKPGSCHQPYTDGL